jgi:hypothetical protein
MPGDFAEEPVIGRYRRPEPVFDPDEVTSQRGQPHLVQQRHHRKEATAVVNAGSIRV